eukprot:CAMPEP_0114321284 /NCGR_PEP_ID=MMETSP0059-20121206/26482_2 /TAXON_ID=36894 /ORGANISM="Pyramimonas parkeae, Strain CCMP726" /LENGTH=72 /DNA_ID=CAMNT_0001448927 /DNA_START=791 /DNA_END=1009 /DNA_ORIENTATION=-
MTPCNADRRSSSAGMEPVVESAPPKLRCASVVSRPICIGMVPVSKKVPRWSHGSVMSHPSSVGMVPVNDSAA